MFHATHVVSHKYEEALDDTGIVLFDTQGNLWGFLAENNAAADVYLQFFDSNSGSSGNPVFTIRIPASSAVGKDIEDKAAYHFANGCSVRAVDARAGSSLSVAGPTLQFWYAKH